MAKASRGARGANHPPTKGDGRKRGGADHAAEIGQLLQQGMGLQRKGQLWLAQQCYQEILARDPDQPDALHLMSLIALEAMRVGPAVDMLKRAVAKKPGDPALRNTYAGALMRNNDPVAAERQLRRALKLSPNHLEFRCRLASCLAMLGREEDARQTFEAVLADHPQHPTALIGLARLLLELGEVDQARAIFRQAVDHNIEPARALAGLAECQTFQESPPELAEIEALLAIPGLRPQDAIRLRQAAAKICDDIGRYDEAFQYHVAAKDILRSSEDEVDYSALYAHVRSVFTPQLFASHSGHGVPSQKPVFIIGMPRSGTTLTEQIIASHPRAAGAGEIGEVRRIAVSMGFGHSDRTVFARRIAQLRSKEAAALAKDCLDALARFSSSAARITDKLPHTFEVLGLVALLFPKAKIVHCRRNALDTCLSCFVTPLREAHSYAQDLTTLGAYYREYVALMDYWRKVLPLPILDVDYEELVADPEGQSRRIIDFIGLDWDPACLDFQATDRAVRTMSRAQVRQPIYRTSVERWRRYEKHLAPLRAALGDLAE